MEKYLTSFICKYVHNNKHQMRYGGNDKHSETRKIRIYIFFLGKIILNRTLVSPNLGTRGNFVVTPVGWGNF